MGFPCLLYTSDAADDTPCVDLGGRRIIKSVTSLIFELGKNYKQFWKSQTKHKRSVCEF